MIKRTFIVSAFLTIFCSLFSFADNAVKMIQADGSESYFLLSSKPKVSINGEELNVVTLNENISVEFVSPVTFEFCEYEDTAVKGLEVSKPVFKINGLTLEASNLEPNSSVTIYDSTGRKVAAGVTDNSGNVTISISSLPNGAFIVNSKANNFKFHKK